MAMAKQDAYKQLQAKVDALKQELPCISFGYLGNYERWGDDTHWYIFLPHYGRVGTYSDQYGLGPGKQADIFEIALNEWDSKIVPALRKMYAKDPHRIHQVYLRNQLLVEDNGCPIGLGQNPPPRFKSEDEAADYLRHYNYPATLVRTAVAQTLKEQVQSAIEAAIFGGISAEEANSIVRKLTGEI